MFHHNFWIISVIVKLILFGALTYYVNKVKNCIDSADASGIKENFKAVEITTYVIVLFNYGLFALKYINTGNDKKSVSLQPQNCGLSYVNLSLVLVLLSFVWQTKAALVVSEKNPVPISFLSDNFKLTENISYILLIFNVLTSGIIFLFNKKNESGGKINISPRSKNY